jgi:hypothetical protein
MKAVRWNVAVLGLAVLMGCEIIPTRPPASSFFVARLQDCKVGAVIPPRDHFAAGEVPTVVLVNYAGRTVTIQVSDATTGRSVYNNTVYVPQDRPTVWWSITNLLTGSYKAELVMEGTRLQTCEFAVDNPTPARRAPPQR